MEETFIAAAFTELGECILLRNRIPNGVRNRLNDMDLKRCIHHYIAANHFGIAQDPAPGDGRPAILWIILASESHSDFNHLWPIADEIMDPLKDTDNFIRFWSTALVVTMEEIRHE